MSLIDHIFLSEDRNYDEFVEYNQIPLLDNKDLCAVADEVMNDNGYLNMQQNNDLYYEFCANIGVNDQATLTFEAICSSTGTDVVLPWEKIECFVSFTPEELYAKVNELLKAESTSIAALFNREEGTRKEDLFSDGKYCFGDVEDNICRQLSDFTNDLFVDYQNMLHIADGDSPDTIDDEITNLSIAMTKILLWQDKHNLKRPQIISHEDATEYVSKRGVTYSIGELFTFTDGEPKTFDLCVIMLDGYDGVFRTVGSFYGISCNDRLGDAIERYVDAFEEDNETLIDEIVSGKIAKL